MENIPAIVDFRAPPVVEVVCGIQFEPIANFGAVHLGLLWSRLRDVFPTFKELPPLPMVLENLGAPHSLQSSFGMFGAPALSRVQFVNDTGGHFVQVQNGRFLQNWQKTHLDDSYARYKSIRPSFLDQVERFRQFVAEEKLGAIHPNQYELTYLNHIPEGDLWDDLRGVSDLLTWFTPTNSVVGNLYEPEFALHSVVPQCLGRLHVSGKVGLRVSDRVRVFQLELTVRGAPRDPQGGDLPQWLDAAREVIVKSFVELTSDRARRLWGQNK